MHRHRPSLPRSSHLRRPRRPPDKFGASNARFFARNPQRLLLSSPRSRPQVSFLYASLKPGQWHLTRWLTTDKRQYYKDQAWFFGKTTLITGLVLACGTAATYGLVQNVLEHEKPTPPDWSFLSRTKFRSACGQQKEEAHPNGVIDWDLVGTLYRQVLARLEDPGIDGGGLLDQDDGETMISDAGKMGYDLRNKSDAWKQGYFETLMGCAKAAEYLDGMVVDTTTRVVMKQRYVIGPSNPNATPLPPWLPYAPLEENCVPASPPPENYYVQILTSEGFSSKQRLDAAIAYAEWLNFKGLPHTAEEVFNWAMDIAKRGIPDVQTVIDPSTHVIAAGTTKASKNLISAATSLATHYAQVGDVSKALPIYLSVLRTLREAPVTKQAVSASQDLRPQAETDIQAASQRWQRFLNLIKDPPYQVSNITGDDPLQRNALEGVICDEAELETYIGEILFATASKEAGRAEAIRWTRDAIAKAEAQAEDTNMPKDKRLQCLACARVGIANWVTMAKRMAELEKAERTAKSSASWVPRSWKRRFGMVTAPFVEETADEATIPKWALEEHDAHQKRARFTRRGLSDKLTESPSALLWEKVGWLMKG